MEVEMARHQQHRSGNRTEGTTAPPKETASSGGEHRWLSDETSQYASDERGRKRESDRWASEARKRSGSPARDGDRADLRPTDGNPRYATGDHVAAQRAFARDADGGGSVPSDEDRHAGARHDAGARTPSRPLRRAFHDDDRDRPLAEQRFGGTEPSAPRADPTKRPGKRSRRAR
jgi:hypothetical protein